MPLLRYMPLLSVVILYRGKLDQRCALSKRSIGEKAAYTLGVTYFAHNLNGQNLLKKHKLFSVLLHHLSFFYTLQKKLPSSLRIRKLRAGQFTWFFPWALWDLWWTVSPSLLCFPTNVYLTFINYKSLSVYISPY